MAKSELDKSGGAFTANQILPGEIIIGLLIAIDNENRPLVDFADNLTASPLPALTTVDIHKKHIGRQVALLFAKGNPQSPVIIANSYGFIVTNIFGLIVFNFFFAIMANAGGFIIAYGFGAIMVNRMGFIVFYF